MALNISVCFIFVLIISLYYAMYCFYFTAFIIVIDDVETFYHCIENSSQQKTIY